MVKPLHTFGFLLVLGALSLGLSYLVPDQPVKIGQLELGFFKPDDLLPLEELKPAPVPVQTTEIDSAQGAIDSSAVAVEEVVLETPVLQTGLQYTHVSALDAFFASLQRLKEKGGRVRAIHYGDSQLEGDRITNVVRDKYQKQYGGYGFGYVSANPLVAPSSLNIVETEGLERKTIFGRRDTAIKDGRYGHLASFTALAKTDSNYYGKMVLKERRWGYSRARNYKTVFIKAASNTGIHIYVMAGDSLYSTNRVAGLAEDKRFEISVPKLPYELVMQSDSATRILGLSFESPTGFHMDNVAMRGASGMVFTKLDDAQLGNNLNQEGYSLIIMQFGGNAVPYLKTEEQAKRFARSVGRQLAHMQRLAPNASFIYIGPSDMAYKEGIDMVSYEIIEPLRDALRTEVMSKGAVYWDLYDVMGGNGSMVRWADEESPALAVRDYIHFTPAGAKHVGTLLGNQLDSAHQDWIDWQEELRLEALRAAEEKRRQDSINALPKDTTALNAQ